ncbi:hypothetical protein, partial [Staphylococcus hominis]|uniref:hypothetical protein n=1 Tax=Staphylococcus hominis TaxID=1290 RepID=UPI001C92CEA7
CLSTGLGWLLVSSSYFENKDAIFPLNKNNPHHINQPLHLHHLKTPFQKSNFLKLPKPLIPLTILILVIAIIIL